MRSPLNLSRYLYASVAVFVVYSILWYLQTRLVLSAEDSFVLSTQYLDRQATPQVVRGQFNWNAAGSAIALDAAGDGQQFMVGEGRLLQLNRDGTPTAPGAQNRVLMKVIAK